MAAGAGDAPSSRAPDEFAGNLDRIAFDAFAWSEPDMIAGLLWILCDSDLLRSFAIQRDVALAFLRQVRMGYAKYLNPYHSFRHAFDVTQFCYMLLVLGGQRAASLTPVEALALVVAAICHDLEHPGTDFAFQVSIQSHLSTKYQACESPLETHHLACARVILNDPDCDILGRLPRADRQRVLDLVGQCILATDMSVHHRILARWNDLFPGGRATGDAASVPRDTRVTLVLQMFIKFADIGNVCRPWAVSVHWAQCLIDELMRVHDAVVGLGHVPNAFLSRVSSDPEAVVSGFSANIARPLVDIVVGVMPEASVLLQNLDSNVDHWHARTSPTAS